VGMASAGASVVARAGAEGGVIGVTVANSRE
jgi:hypothetical protein